MKLRKIRIALAAVFFTLITLLLLDFTGTTHVWLGWMAKVQFLPAVLSLNVAVIAVLVVLTLVFGRIYCSVICPLGVFNDIVSWLHKRKKKNIFSYSPAKNWLRYLFLVLLTVGVALGVGSIVTLLSPYGSFAAIVNNVLEPVYLWANNGLAAIAAHFDSYAFYEKEVWIKSVPVFATAVAMLVFFVVLAWRGGRTYCNTICPVGTLLGFISRFSWMKVRIDTDKCKNCSLCGKRCKASCIDTKNHKIDYSRCVACGDCLENCEFGAITYAGRAPKSEKKDAAPVNETRRAVLVGAAIVGADVAMAQAKKRVDGGMTVLEDKEEPARTTPLTPSGSISAANMAQSCVGCQLCVTKCPNGVLRPSSDLTKLMQPVMSYDRGFCRPECTTCSEVCPAGAIQPISVADKSSIQIGHAVWRRKYCIVLTDEVDCGNCARHCPTGAIQMVQADPNDDASPFIPVVNEAKCIGCGSCEYVCPARPNSAMYVEGHEVHKTI